MLMVFVGLFSMLPKQQNNIVGDLTILKQKERNLCVASTFKPESLP